MLKSIKNIITVFLLTVAFTTHAQLVVSTTQTPQQLVQNILAGNGVTVSNITYTGDPNAIGEFSGTTNLGITSGIVMTTGTVLNNGKGPQGPNSSSSTGVDNAYNGDMDLTNIAGTVTNNAAILEFDFVPSGDTIKFNYVFGSEEYPEYVCSNFNDIFAFLISGPNPGGGNYTNQNIAIIPGTSLAVAINTVNPGVPGSNSFGGGCTSLAYSNFYVNNTGTTVQYDGFTKVLAANAPVVCGSTYHLKLAIADAVDGSYDSGVFLEAGSLTANVLNVAPKVAFGINDSTLYEGCGSAEITFTRSGNVSGMDTIALMLTGTAIDNADYTLSSTNLVAGGKLFFNPGEDSVTINLQTIQDALAEPMEDILLNLSYTLCNKTYTKLVHLFVADVPSMAVKANNDTVMACPSQVTIKAQASGGLSFGNYKYTWNTGQQTNSFTATPTQTTQYIVSASDTCGIVVAKDTVNITLNYIPLQLTPSADVSICKGVSTMLSATASNGLPIYKYTWQPGAVAGNSLTVAPLATTIYTITAIDSCNVSVSKQITVSVPSPRAAFTYDYVTNAELNFLNTSSSDVVTWQWSFGDSSTQSILVNPTHTYLDTGTYVVGLIVTNNIGCIDTIYENVNIYPDLYFYFPNAFTPNGDGLNDYFGGKGVGVFTYQMQIFDRWGELIFTSTDMNNMWDGLTKNGKAPTGIYICVFNATGARETTIKKVGSVTLLR